MGWLDNLIQGIQQFDPFGLKAKSISGSNLASQKQLRTQQEVQRGQEIQTRQQQIGGLPRQQYQDFLNIGEAGPIYTPPLTPLTQTLPFQPQSGDPSQMSQDERQRLWEQAGHSGIAPAGYGGESGGGGGDPVNDLLGSLVNPLQMEIENWWKRLDEYDKKNPFAFDEALARASAGERLNPYFDATMNEFMTGIRRSSQRSVEDMTRTIGELNVDASKLSDKERFATQEAIRSSEEGFSGSGLFFSGKRARTTGVEEVQGEQRQEDIQTDLSRNTGRLQRGNLRLQEDLALQEARQKRLTESERTTALETDIAGQKRESAYQRGLEQLQFAGKIPGTGPADQLRLENEFLSGLR